MKILGIDPSLRSTGFGVIEVRGNQMSARCHGCIQNPKSVLPSRCLVRIGDEVLTLETADGAVVVRPGRPAAPDGVISGSPPSGGGAEFYASLIDAARSAGARVFVDSSGEGLRASAKASPEFLKVNRAEAEGLLGRPIKDAHEAVHGAMEIIENGAGSAAITLGADGLVWVESKHGPVWSARPPQLKVISAVGSGDSTLGGFACAAARGLIGEDALRLAVACGAANCLADAPARIDRSTVESLIPKIEVQRHAF